MYKWWGHSEVNISIYNSSSKCINNHQEPQIRSNKGIKIWTNKHLWEGLNPSWTTGTDGLYFFVQLQSIVPIKLAWSVLIFFSWCIVSFPIGFGTYSMYVYTIYTPVIDTPWTILQLRVFGVLLILSCWLPPGNLAVENLENHDF